MTEERPSTTNTRIARTALPHDVIRASLEAIDRGERAALATVVGRSGSAPSTPGQKLLLTERGDAIGTIGGGAVERVVLAEMAKALVGSPPLPRISTFRLGASLGMCCGGSVDVLIEAVVPPAHALVIGAGHVGVFLAPLLASLGFQVTLADARAEAADPSRLVGERGVEPPPVAGRPVRVVHADHDDPEVMKGLPCDVSGAVFLVMTHDHQIDQAAIEWALGRGFGFVGGVGSRAKAARTRTRLEAKGFAAADLARIRMPVGLPIGARTPAEIGVSIASELVAWRAERDRARSETPGAARRSGEAKGSERSDDAVEPSEEGLAEEAAQ